jgi:hypothetical protein
MRFDLKTLGESGADPLDSIVKEYGLVYVTSITRDGCSGCVEQKPLFQELAARLDSQHHGRVAFSNLHVQYSEGDVRESEQAKRTFHHGSYPTYMIHVKSEYGPLEHYRAAYPKMEELEKQINSAFDLAESYARQAQKPA